ncbi:MAG: HEAT repeat domain-containing protein [Caldilinea sp.]|nr:HEAT repeat domain-containing protein [Caldilinea sp.]
MADQPFPADFDDDFEDDFEDDLEDDFEDDDAWQSDFPEEDDDSDEDGAVFHRNGYARHQIDELLSEGEADGAGDPQPTWTLEELLDRLAVDPENVPFAEYFLFSDLTRTQAAYVRSKWHALDVATRRKVLAVLTGALDEFVSLDISALLLAVLDDADSEIRTVAVYTLGDGDAASELLGPLIALVENDPSEEVRAAAASGLGAFVLAGELDEMDSALAMRAEEVLMGLLTNPVEPVAVQCRALESIAYSGETAVRQFIEDAYYSPLEEMRLSALVAMGRSADIRWRRLARAELGSPSPAMRAEAATACGELEAKAALPDLLELLDDEEQIVRLSVIFALGRLGGQRARTALEEIAAGEDVYEAQAAEMALEEMMFYTGADATAIPLFDDADDEEMLEDVDPWDEWPDDDDDDLGEYE